MNEGRTLAIEGVLFRFNVERRDRDIRVTVCATDINPHGEDIPFDVKTWTIEKARP